jgi:hypothetical protein
MSTKNFSDNTIILQISNWRGHFTDKEQMEEAKKNVKEKEENKMSNFLDGQQIIKTDTSSIHGTNPKNWRDMYRTRKRK